MEDDITVDLDELDHQIVELERLHLLAVECEFEHLAALLGKDLAEARLWRSVLHPAAQEGAGK